MIVEVRRKPRRLESAELDPRPAGAAPTRVDLIRAAARRHFAEHGFDGASMRDIAADAGITIATLYFHCATKEQLLFDVLEGAMTQLLAALDTALASAPPTWSGQLAVAIRIHIEYCARRDYGASISSSELRGLTGELRERHIATRNRFEGRFREIVAGGIAAHEFHTVDVPLVVAGILGIGLNVGRWYQPAGRLSLAEIVGEYTNFTLDSLRSG